MAELFKETITTGVYHPENYKEPVNFLFDKMKAEEEWDEHPVLYPTEFAETEPTLEVHHENVIYQVLY